MTKLAKTGGVSRRLLSGTALASAAACALIATPASAQEECGPTTEGTVTCTAADNPYPNGIFYSSPAVDPLQDPGLDPDAPVYDLTVNLGTGVAIDTGATNPGVALIGFNDGAVTLNSFGDTSIAVTGTGALGVLALTNYGDLTINTDSITATGRASGGINANSNQGNIAIDADTTTVTGDGSVGISANSFTGDVDITAGTVTVEGLASSGIVAYSNQGNVTINAGTVTTTADGGYVGLDTPAIEAVSVQGTTSVAVDSVSTSGVYADGINAYGGVSATVTAGTISTTGYESNGILVQSPGDASITVGSISTTGDYSNGAIAVSLNGTASVTSTGSVSTTGYGAYGVIAYGFNGDATVVVNDVSTTGDNSTAVYASGNVVDVTINGNVSTQGTASPGVDAFANNTVTVTNNGTVTTAGDGSTGILATGIYGAVVEGTGSVTTSGDNADGLFVRSLFGDVDVTVGDVTTSGTNSAGVAAISYFGNASVTSTGSVSTAGDGSIGVYAGSFNGLYDADVTVNDVATTGDNSPAVSVYGYNASATINGNVSTSGAASTGVSVLAIAGNATVANNGSVTTTGVGSIGVNVAAYGDVTVTGTGSVSSSATGINAYSFAGNIDITQGDIATTEDGAAGIAAETNNYNYTAGNISITVGDITTTGDNADGINATALGGGSIEINHGAINTSGTNAFGVFALGAEDVSITGTSVTTTGEEAAGVYGVSFFGNVAIDTGTVSTTGQYAPGVVGASYFGNVSITADDVTTTGDTSKGVYGVAFYAGNTNVTVGNVTTSGDYSVGVDAQAYYGASVTVNGTVATSGDYAPGVNVYAVGLGGADVDNNATVLNNGAIRTSGTESNGITAEAVFGDVVISGTGSVATTGDFSTGILARSTYGAVDITAGTVTTTGIASGIDAYASGGVSITVDTVRTAGADSNAINAGGFYSVDVTANTVSTTGASANGIDVVSFGGDVTVAAGSVLVSGTDSTAIRALGFGGGANVSVTGAVRSTSGTAIDILAAGAGGAGGPAVGDPANDGIARVLVGTNGSVQGGTNAITTDALNGTQITNRGSIIGGSGYAIEASGGAATINNIGSITGRLLLTDNSDTLTNSGTFTLVGNSDFGGGNDLLTNSGTVRFGSAAGAQNITLVGLESFANSGLVDLRNGVAGDRLTLAAYTGSGPAALGLDIAFGATPTVDRLNVTTATGSTSVVLNPLNGPATLIPTTTLIQASAASSATAFTLSAGSQFNGLIQYGLVYNPTSFAYQLISAPNATVYRQAKLGEGISTLWNRSADAITAHLAADRDSGWGAPTADSAGRIWLQMFGEVNKRDETRSFGFNGLAQNDVDLGYKQDVFGGQIGFDLYGTRSDTGGFTVGVSGGYASSVMHFAGNDRFQIDAVNGTLYAGFRAGGLFLNGLAKYDYAWIKNRGNAPVSTFNLETKAQTWGGKVEAGFRFGSNSFFIEPAASIAYTSTDMDRYGVYGGTFDFDDFTGLRGKAGARIGGSTPVGSSTLVFYAGAAAVHEFKGEDGLLFSSGGQTVRLTNDRLGTYGQGTLGLNIVTSSGVTGFIEAHGEYNDEYSGGGGRAGIRIKF